MLPSAHPLDSATARQWSALAAPRWVHAGLLPLGWLAAVAIAATEDARHCTAADPSLCGPDVPFAVLMAVAFATPVFLVWKPLLGCVAGVAFGVADLTYDSLPAANLAFGLHGLACLVVGGRLVAADLRQRRLAEVEARSVRHVPPHPLTDGEGRPDPDPGWRLRALAATVGLLLTGLGAAGLYAARVTEENDHLQRSVQVNGAVTAVDEDAYLVDLALASWSGERTVRVSPIYVEDYPVGTRVPVLTDPQDDGWVRLVAEPADFTGWLTLGAGAVLLAAILVAGEFRRRRSVAALWSDPQPAFAVRVTPDPRGNVLVLPFSGGGRPIARFGLAWIQGPAGRAEDDEDPPFVEGPDADSTQVTPVPEPAVLLGHAAYGRWVAVVLDGQVFVPDGPLRRPSRRSR